jgi:thiol-disulfide isomerase/thioredoxin
MIKVIRLRRGNCAMPFRRIRGLTRSAVLLFMVANTTAGSAFARAADDAADVARRYKALADEIEAKHRLWGIAVQISNRDRQDLDARKRARELRPDFGEYAKRFHELARKYPSSPEALDALSYAIDLYSQQRTYTKTHPVGIEECVEQLRADWVSSPRLGEFLWRISHSGSTAPNCESLLRDALTRNQGRDARGHAMYALAVTMSNYAAMRRQAAEAAKRAEELESLLGREQLSKILARDPDAMLEEARELFAKVAKEYSDVKLFPADPKETRSLGRLASAWLARDGEFAIGKPVADVTGKTLDGMDFKLSDHKGKVVVIVFWASWCGPCIQMYPIEKQLEKQFRDRPFLFLGINYDYKVEDARKAILKEQILWPNLYDGRESDGRIGRIFHIAGDGIPRVFVIDRQGIIRFKDLRDEKLIHSVEELLKEKNGAENGAKSKDAAKADARSRR